MKTCGATNREGEPCRLSAGARTDHLGFGRCAHHGGCTPSGRQFAAREAAAAAAAKLGAVADTDPSRALALAIAIAEGEVRFLLERVRELESGIVGDDLHPVARALGGSAERLARMAKLGLDAGVEERRLELDAVVVERLAGAVRAALSEVDLSPRQQAELRGALERHLLALDAEPARRLAA